jgi:hypothetical protein
LALILHLAFVDPTGPSIGCGKPALKPIVEGKSKMSIRLRAATGLLQVTVCRYNFARAIDKNCGEIDKKCWTEARFDFTLEADR